MSLLLQDGTNLLLQDGSNLLLQSVEPPVFTVDPVDTTVTDGQTATFTALATGNPAPSYQWYEAPSTPLGGETGQTLQIPTTLLDSGKQYFCRATNDGGVVDSATATLTVVKQTLSIATDPQDVTAIEDDGAVFTAQAVGKSVTQQWYQDGVGAIAGETGLSLNVQTPLSADGNGYYIIGTDAYGDTVQSSTATLTVVDRQGVVRQGYRIWNGSQWIEFQPGGSTRWRGDWVQQKYYESDQVIDDGYLMIANKETEARAKLQGDGTVYSIFDDLGGSFATATVSDDALFTGLRVTLPGGAFIKGWRWYAPEASGDMEYSVWVWTEDRGLELLMPPTVPSVIGWQEYSYKRFWRPGVEADLVLVVRQINQTTNFSSTWDQINKNGDPAAGEAIFQSDGRHIRVHHDDSTLTDRQADLEAVPVGATITFGGGEWTVVEVTTETNHVTFELAPIQSRPPNGVKTFTFSYGATANLSYVWDEDLVLANPDIRGIEGAIYDPTDRPIGNDNYYGLDLILEDVLANPDWDFQAYSEMGTAAAGSVDGSILNLSKSLFDGDRRVHNREITFQSTGSGWQMFGCGEYPAGYATILYFRVRGKDTGSNTGFFMGRYALFIYNDGAGVVSIQNLETITSKSTTPQARFRVALTGDDVCCEVEQPNAETWDWHVEVIEDQLWQF